MKREVKYELTEEEMDSLMNFYGDSTRNQRMKIGLNDKDETIIKKLHDKYYNMNNKDS